MGRENIRENERKKNETIKINYLHAFKASVRDCTFGPCVALSRFGK
jgi:hypothetical protein